MIEISFEINGKKINPNNIGNAIEAAAISTVKDSIAESVGTIKCSKHSGRPKINMKGRNLENINIEISGCCDELIERVERKLK